MKNLKLLILVLLPFTSFSQNVEWNHILTGPNLDVITDVAVDQEDNIYSVGYFKEDIYFGSSSNTFTSDNRKNIFIEKISPTGIPIWWKKIGVSYTGVANKIIFNSKGDFYLLGRFSDTISIGSKKIVSTGTADIIIAKFSTDGSIIWEKVIGGQGSEYPKDIAIDALDNIYIIGTFSDPVNFGDLDNPIILTPKKDRLGDNFIVRYSDEGQLAWVRQFGEQDSEFKFTDIEIKQQKIFLAGGFKSDFDFDFNCNEGTNTLNSEGFNHAFVLTMTTDANFIHVKQIKSYQNVDIVDIVVDDQLNIYGTGSFKTLIKIDDTSFTTNQFRNAFIFKLDDDKQLVWAKQYTSPACSGLKIALDSKRNIYLTGNYSNKMIIGTDSLTVDNDIDYENFLLTLNQKGELQKAYTYCGSTSRNSPQYSNVILDNHSHIILFGDFQGNVDLNPNKDVTEMIQADSVDSYIIKFTNEFVSTKNITLPTLSYLPNPVLEQIHLDLSQEGKEYQIFNTMGKMVKKGNTSGTIDLKSLQTGIYFLKIRGYQTIKVLKK